jgi:hypothetical protein
MEWDVRLHRRRRALASYMAYPCRTIRGYKILPYFSIVRPRVESCPYACSTWVRPDFLQRIQTYEPIGNWRAAWEIPLHLNLESFRGLLPY